MPVEVSGLPDKEYWEERARELRPQLDDLQQRFDEGRLPPADDIEALGREILKSIEPSGPRNAPIE